MYRTNQIGHELTTAEAEGWVSRYIVLLCIYIYIYSIFIQKGVFKSHLQPQGEGGKQEGADTSKAPAAHQVLGWQPQT